MADAQVNTVASETNAAQIGLNNTSWMATNLSDGSTGYMTQVAAAQNTWPEILGCVGSVVTLGSLVAAAVAAPPVGGAALALYGGMLGAAILAGGACGGALADTPPNGQNGATWSSWEGVEQNMNAGLANMFSESLSSLDPGGNHSIVYLGTGFNKTENFAAMMTPGFTPSTSVLKAAYPDMTAAAKAEYFPHGLTG